MKGSLSVCLFFFLGWLLAAPLLATGQGLAQPRQPIQRARVRIAGRIEYADHSGIPDVQVTLEGTSLKRNTDSLGSFVLVVPDSIYKRLSDSEIDSMQLRFTYLGLWEQRVRLGGLLQLPNNENARTELLATPFSTQISTEIITRHAGSAASLTIRDIKSAVAAQGLQLTRPFIADTASYATPDARMTKLPAIPVFPVQPPRPTTPEQLLPQSFLAGARRLRDVDERLRRVLDPAGYGGHVRYYAYPRGFALVTLTERTDGKARPMLTNRFNVNELPQTNGGEWFQNLFTQVPKGFFRVMVFVVTTDDIFTTEDGKVSVATVLGWANSGPGILPVGEPYSIGNQPCTPNHRCTVWVYELQKSQSNRPAALFSSGFSSLDNLKRSGVRLQP